MGDEPTPAPRARHVLLTGAVILLLAVGLRAITEAYSVPSSSMEPTLLPGDHLVVVRYVTSDPARGDVVVFEDGTGATLVKRIIGMPGDSVQISAGHVMINGEPLNEDAYAAPSHSASVTVHVVPAGHFFLLGDNRDHSADSRTFGFVPRRSLVGRARLVYWSSDPGPSSGRVRWRRLLHSID